MSFWRAIVGKWKNFNYITVVSGLPRSGTSMMMAMLEAGGMPILTDNLRRPDQDNPLGYKELEKVKKIDVDNAWVKRCRGKAFKMVSALLHHLPVEHTYKVIFMERRLSEILASQRAMLTRLQREDDVSDVELTEKFERHLVKIKAWLEEQQNIDVFYANFNVIIGDPRSGAAELNRFLGGRFDAASMAGVVERSLYRQRK